MKRQIYYLYAAVLSILLVQCTNTNNTGNISSIASPAQENSSLPYLYTDQTGTTFMSWVHRTSSERATLKYARLSEGRWSAPSDIAEGDNWFVNWADFPSIIASEGTPAAAHWLKKVPGNAYSYHIQLVRTQSDGSWSAPINPHQDNTATEHGFVSMIPWQNDQIMAVWLDGRATADRTEEEYSDISKAMTLRSAIIDKDGTITRPHLIDSTVCDCCQTSLTKIPGGAIAAYRDRTEDEIRDIYVSRFTEEGWSKPKRVHDDNWKIGGCPVNGPAVVSHNDRVLISWFTAAGNTPKVKASYSFDRGKSFAEPITVDDGNPLGRVGVEMNESGGIVSWMEKTDDGNAEFRFKRIDPDGMLSPPTVIAEMDPGRRSGFPQITLAKNQLIAAWTVIGERPIIHTVNIEL